MAKNPDLPRIVACGADGKVRRIAAEHLEIDLGCGRKVIIGFPAQAWGDLDIEARTDEGTPLIHVMPGGCNQISLRVDACDAAAPVELGELPAPAQKPELALTVQKALDETDKALAPRKHRIRRWARAALRRSAEVTVRLVGEEEGRALNRDYRGKDYATNVLTFVYGEDQPDESVSGAPLAGDLVLCVPVVAREAAGQGKDLEAHYAHLVVHGMLHLQGYGHDTDADAAVMEALETEVLAALGYADPYA